MNGMASLVVSESEVRLIRAALLEYLAGIEGQPGGNEIQQVRNLISTIERPQMLGPDAMKAFAAQ